jgi:hypothetical protein
MPQSTFLSLHVPGYSINEKKLLTRQKLRLIQLSKDVNGKDGKTNKSDKNMCSSQFMKNVSPRSNQSVHGVPPSVNEPIRSVLHELVSADYAQPRVTMTLIAM